MNVSETIQSSKKIPLETKTIIHIMLVNQKINEILNSALKPFDISVQQFNVLRILRGQKGQPANLSTLNERMVSKTSNTTRLVDKLIHKGYVHRIICASNRRKIEITITEEGKSILAKLDKIIKEREHELVNDFTTNELEQLNILLHKF